MDSISQIVLGAAVGEVVLGKKIGNKAMLWGAVAGTIPDLDVLSSPFMSEINSLAFHRGISHSIFFSILAALLFGWLVFKYEKSKSVKHQLEMKTKLKDWQLLFFWALFTHPLLDCFTMYGTQLFAPFSNYRVAFSTVAVADFFYTIPFIFCLIVASRFNKNERKRRVWNWAGISWSCFYLLLTVFNKQYVTSVCEAQLVSQGINTERMIVGPTILSNFLWTATVETDENYLQGQYSLFDESPIDYVAIPKNRNLIPKSENDKTIQTLRWFSDDYFNVINTDKGGLQMNDLRFGTFSGIGNNEDDFIFRFALTQEADGSYVMSKAEGGPPRGKEMDMFPRLWERIKGQ